MPLTLSKDCTRALDAAIAEERVRYASERLDFHTFFCGTTVLQLQKVIRREAKPADPDVTRKELVGDLFRAQQESPHRLWELRPDELPSAAWRILASNFGEAIYLLRFEEPLASLDGSQWSVLVWVAHSWASGDDSPSQASLARLAGLSIRTVSRSLVALEQLGLLRVARDKGVNIELGVGPRLAPMLRDFTFCRDPKIWRWTPRLAALTADNHTDGSSRTPDSEMEVVTETPDNEMEVITETPDNGAYGSASTPDNETEVRCRSRYDEPRAPEPFASAIPHNLKRIPIDESPLPIGTPANVATPSPPPPDPLLRNKKKEDLSSLPSSEGGTPATVSGVVDATTTRRLALDALAVRFLRANPGIPLPRTCDAGDVKLVEACTAKGTWDAQTLRQTHLDAIDGAFEKAPPDRPPTPMYIWGQFRFFLENARIGRAKRLRAEAPPPKPKKDRPPPEDPPASSEWLEQHMREARARLATIADISKPKPQLRFGEDTE